MQTATTIGLDIATSSAIPARFPISSRAVFVNPNQSLSWPSAWHPWSLKATF